MIRNVTKHTISNLGLTCINWKTAKEMVLSGSLTAIGSNLYNINNQGSFFLSADGSKLHKVRNSHPSTLDVIAKKATC